MSSVKKMLATASLTFMSMLAASGSAQAFDFTCVTGSGGCTAEGTSIASWSLADGVLTISTDADAGNAFISGISFDASAGQTVALSATQGAGVLYASGGGANLPNSLGWSIDYEVKPKSPPPTNGINAGESLSFDVTGVTLADIAKGSFKFGVHVQALAGDRSEKLINSPVPEAEAYALVLGGLGVLALMRRRLS